jgi:hypothetical protein
MAAAFLAADDPIEKKYTIKRFQHPSLEFLFMPF